MGDQNSVYKLFKKKSTIKIYSPFLKLHREKMIPGTPITAPSKPANQSQYPNLN